VATDTIGELAEHKHRLMSDSSTTTATTDTVYALTDHKVELTATGANYRDLNMIDYAGSSNPHNNLQPFTSVYIFKRVL